MTSIIILFNDLLSSLNEEQKITNLIHRLFCFIIFYFYLYFLKRKKKEEKKSKQIPSINNFHMN